jgi:hypothetical protein
MQPETSQSRKRFLQRSDHSLRDGLFGFEGNDAGERVKSKINQDVLLKIRDFETIVK